MKKLALLVSIVIVLALLALPSFAAGPVYDDLPDLEGAEIAIAVENFYMPYQFVDPRQPDRAIGFEYDVVNEICSRINCVPSYQETTFDLQLAGVASGEYDMAMNGLFITEERQEIYDFTVPYSYAETFLLVRADEDRFEGVEEFLANDDLLWGAQNGSFGQFIATDIYEVPSNRIVVYDEFSLVLVALANGDVDTMNADGFGGQFVSENSELYKLSGAPLLDPVPLGLMFTKGSPYVDAFSAAIESMQADGFMDFLYHKWGVDFRPFSGE